MNVKKYHVGLFVVVVLVFFLLFNHRFEFIISLENYKNQVRIVKNLNVMKKVYEYI